MARKGQSVTVFDKIGFSVIRTIGIGTGIGIGTKRLIHHLWRMYFALFIATAIFFGGNSNILPKVLRTELILTAPIVTVLIFMFGWLVYFK